MADIIFIAILLIFVRAGAKKGLIKTLMGTVSTLLSLILTALIYNPFSQMLYNSKLGEYVTQFVKRLFEEKAQKGNVIPLFDKAVETGSILIINIISFIVVIIVIRLFLAVLSRVLNLAAKLPVIKQLNSLLGMFAGAVSGLLVCYIIIGIIGTLNGEGNISIIQKSIENSYLVIKIYENNIVSNLLLTYLY